MFGPDGLKPWKTKKGQSRLDTEIDEIAAIEKAGERVSVSKDTGEVMIVSDKK